MTVPEEELLTSTDDLPEDISQDEDLDVEQTQEMPGPDGLPEPEVPGQASKEIGKQIRLEFE